MALTSKKAKEMLKHGEAKGSPLTKKQKGYFGLMAGKMLKKKMM